MGRTRAGTSVTLAVVVAIGMPLSSGDVAATEVKIALISVQSGMTFKMVEGSLDYRLFGIGTCEPNQLAHLNGVAWPCGAVVTGWLTQLTLGDRIDCIEEGRAPDQYATVLVRCFLPSGEDIAKLALEEGLAWIINEEGEPTVREYGVVEQEARNQNAAYGPQVLCLEINYIAPSQG